MQMVLSSMTNIKAASRKAGKTSEKIKVSWHHKKKYPAESSRDKEVISKTQLHSRCNMMIK